MHKHFRIVLHPEDMMGYSLQICRNQLIGFSHCLPDTINSMHPGRYSRLLLMMGSQENFLCVIMREDVY